MSWAKVEGKNSRAVMESVKVSIRPETRRGTAAVSITIGADVWQKLGWNSGCRVDAYWGEGKDAGSVKIERSDRGRLILRKPGRGPRACLVTQFGQLPKNARRHGLPATEAKFVVTPGSELVVTLPHTFWVKYERKTDNPNRGRPRGTKGGRDQSAPAADREHERGLNGSNTTTKFPQLPRNVDEKVL